MIFHTSRLYVRQLTLQDFEAFHEMQGNPKVMRFTTGKPYSEEENKKGLDTLITCYQNQENSFWVWAVAQKTDDAFVGTCAIVKNEKDENEIGYRFLEKFWGRGYGIEITEGLIDYCTNQLKMKMLVAYVDKNNLASVRVLDKSRFRFVKEYYNEECKCIDRFYQLKAL